MTKQEQIEEMAKDLENTILGLGIHLCRKSAEKLYDLGYRKGETISYKAMIDHSYLDRINELLIDFDEMGFVPTTLCENPDKYAQDWRKQLLVEIKRLKAENEELSKVVSSKVYDFIDNTKEIADAREAWEQQAKIDVLNELWGKVKDEGVDYKIGMRALSEEIDELIKEIEK